MGAKEQARFSGGWFSSDMAAVWLLATAAVLLQMAANGSYGYFRDGESLIMLNWQLDDARYWCQNVEEGPQVGHPYAMGWEHYTILICHGLKKPLAEAWPRFKVWD